MRIRRRAYAEHGNELRPMDLACMREHGPRAVKAICLVPTCGNEASVNGDGLPADTPVPDVGPRLRCSQCVGKEIKTMPDWSVRTAYGAWPREPP
jgi:hypothetical protein